MTFLQIYAKEIVSLVAPFVAWALARFFKAKAKIILASPHSFTFLVQEPLKDMEGTVINPTQTVKTVSYLIKNTGSEPAKNIELVFNWKPLCINIWPSRHITEHVENDNRYVVMFESLAPYEFVGFELLTVNSEAPALITARSEQCVAKQIEMYPQQVIKPWLARTAGFLMLVGLGATIYMGLLVLQFLLVRTPVGLG
ncbi:MAG: hypothetical protein GC149_15610 [Gammaproteobacteria bacterium]|nr:hypothetical protein [Gammaproteobacteria bacterium]